MSARGRRVDVLLPTHRGRRWVGEAIDSVLAQTHRDVHLVVVDDASPDGTFDLLRERYGAMPERITLLALETPQRAAGARMEASRHARGAFLAFIDQDDRWLAEKLERQLARIARDPGLAAVHTNVIHIDAAGEPIPGSADIENAGRQAVPWDELQGDALARVLFLSGRVRLVSALLRREVFEALGGFDTSLFGGEDWEFWLRFAAAGHRMALLDDALVERREHQENTSVVHAERRLEGQFAALDRAVARHPRFRAWEAGRRARLLQQDVSARMRAGRAAEARKHLRAYRRGTPAATLAALWLLTWSGPLHPFLERAAARLRRHAGGSDQN